MRYYRPTWAEIHLGNLEHNFRQVQKRLSPKTRIMVTVKADAYGHGLVPVSRKLVSCGVDYLGVASVDEGIVLRKAGVKTPILVMGLVLKKDSAPLFRYRLTATVCDEGLARALDERGRLYGRPLDVHIKVDTGMGRLGVLPEEALALVRKIHRLKNLRIEGIFTHFTMADSNRSFTRRQIRLFCRLLDDLKKEGIPVPLAHAANSMGVLDFKQGHFNMVRPGLILYGLYPKQNLKIKLKPLLALKTRVIFKKRLPPGWGVSYGRTYITKRRTTVITLPIGYGDGYPRLLSNKAPVLIGGKRFKVCGRICMDHMMVEVGDSKVRIGDEVVLIGSQGKMRITTEELAQASKTIPYEIVCGLGSRIPRLYIR
ncbi:MAG: alanine racemase [Candidatus Omnitrophota bacterium]